MLVGIRSFSCRSVFMVLHYFHICTQKKRVNFEIGLHAFGYGSVFIFNWLQFVTSLGYISFIRRAISFSVIVSCSALS